MPLYEYEDLKTGERVELCRAVERRDEVPPNLRRITVPKRLGVLMGALSDSDVDRAAPRAFRQLEDTMNAKDIARQTGFSIDQIRRAWAMCIAWLLLAMGTQAADISAGYVFADNEKNITAAKLNAVAGSAVINPAFITSKTAASSVAAADLLLIYSQSGLGLRRATLADLFYTNTALFTTQTAYTAPDYYDLLLLYSATNGGYRTVKANRLFPLGLPENLPALASPTNNPTFVVWDGGTNLAYKTVSLTNLPSLLTPTNLLTVTYATNGEVLTVWDQTNAAAKRLLLADVPKFCQTNWWSNAEHQLTNLGG